MKKLEINQMENLQGGVSAEEYCDTIYSIYATNGAGWSPEVLDMFYSQYTTYCV